MFGFILHIIFVILFHCVPIKYYFEYGATMLIKLIYYLAIVFEKCLGESVGVHRNYSQTYIARLVVLPHQKYYYLFLVMMFCTQKAYPLIKIILA